MNPAMVARVMRAADPGPLVNTAHTSIMSAGLAFGTWAGGIGIAAGYGLRSPLSGWAWHCSACCASRRPVQDASIHRRGDDQ